MKIMIVDDEEDITNLTGIIFDVYGYDTIKVYSGTECLDKLRKGEKPDIILLDIMMPGISGYDICRKIKSDEKTHEIPVVILSAKTSESDMKEGYSAGADGYISKPFDPQNMVRQVESYIKKRQ